MKLNANHLLSLAALIAFAPVANAGVWSCDSQAPCIQFTMNELNTSSCGVTGDCTVEVCMLVSSSLPGCSKSDTFSHMCHQSDGNGCPLFEGSTPLMGTGTSTDCALSGENNDPAFTGKCSTADDVLMCQEGIPGDTLYWILKDGAEGGNPNSLTVEDETIDFVVDSCNLSVSCKSHEFACGGNSNQAKFERTWAFAIPDGSGSCPSPCSSNTDPAADASVVSPNPAPLGPSVSDTSPSGPIPDATLLVPNSGPSFPTEPAMDNGPTPDATLLIPNSGPTFPTEPAMDNGPTPDAVLLVPNSGPSFPTEPAMDNGPTPDATLLIPNSGPTFPTEPAMDNGPTPDAVLLVPNSGPTFPTEPAMDTSGTGGDPHFKTWIGEHFEFHGQCDLVLAKDDNFADGLGLDVQIRTKLVRYWSYIKRAAIRIGEDILEVEGSADLSTNNPIYWYNFEYQGETNTMGSFPLEVKVGKVNSRKHHFNIDLSSKYPGHKISIVTFKEFIKVEFVGSSKEAFGNAVGMMGDFSTGKTLARDGATIMDDFNELGNEWQVRPADTMLFHDVSDPQFPKRCVIPEDPQGQRRRRLEESSVTMKQAERACSALTDERDRKDCVYDIIATQDLDMTGAY